MPPVRSVERALAVLTCLAGDDLRLVDIAERVGLHKATVSRLLASLAKAGMVVRDDRERFTVGPAVVQLAARRLGRYHGVVDQLREALNRLWDETGETVTVHVRIGTNRVCIEELESRHGIAYRAGVGNQEPLHSGSAAKVLLAFLPAHEREALLDQLDFRPVTARTITKRDKFEAELQRVRQQGFAVSFGERILGATAVSVPVLDRDGRAQAAVSILGPDSRMPPPVLERYAALLRKLIRSLSDEPSQVASGRNPRSRR
jgi:DNA-binding IclR family transcriptional regulator